MSNKKLPLYLKEIYGWIYGNKFICKLQDSQIFNDIITLGGYKQLTKSEIREINSHENILQLGTTFGNQMEQVAKATGYYGRYDIVDISKAQIKRCREKYQHNYPIMNFINQDVTDSLPMKYEVVICHMLLHEVPIVKRKEIIEFALNSLTDNGRAVFVDYHNPNPKHPLRYLIRMFNRLYQPFAEKMWEREISSYPNNNFDFNWSKRTFCWGMFQKVVATRKENRI